MPAMGCGDGSLALKPDTIGLRPANSDLDLNYRHGGHRGKWGDPKSVDEGRSFAPPVSVLKLKERAHVAGFDPGQFDDTSGWPHQLYVREARRMISSYVVTQKDLEGTTDPDDSVGLASYGVDDWPYAMHPLDGKAALQSGDYSMLYLEEKHRGIYKIPYRAITPHERECRNLFVPGCCSASHIAMTSIRMEPVWMTLAEASGVATSLAILSDLAVQRVDYAQLRPKLRHLSIKLDHPTFAPKADAKKT